MTYQELKEYVANKRKLRAQQWTAEKRKYGDCTGLNQDEFEKYSDIIVTGKKAYKTKFVHNKLWQKD